MLASFRSPPETLIGSGEYLLYGDITREWGHWIIEQFINQKYLTGTASQFGIAEIYADVMDKIEKLYDHKLSYDDIKLNSRKISKLVYSQVQLFNQASNMQARRSISLEMKENLLNTFGPKPRCWLTGYEFSEEVIENFISSSGKGTTDLVLPRYIDQYLPIGRKARDITIEVDHLYPYSLGGKDELDNYRLVCGWSNAVKSNYITAYSGSSGHLNQNEYYPRSYYYWALRSIGLKRKCEVKGCTNTIENSQLTVCSSWGEDMLITPASMKVVCKEHSITRHDRYIKR
ncbi:MAG: hypothetical protein IBX55_16000 [Methyloprofundus sp.]|nr:hypothetical protein [Methyloprofundus sp.]